MQLSTFTDFIVVVVAAHAPAPAPLPQAYVDVTIVENELDPAISSLLAMPFLKLFADLFKIEWVDGKDFTRW